jgi:shikimate kinase
MGPSLIVFLIGMRGAGKSTVGRVLAAQLGGSFTDLDDHTAVELGFVSASHALRERGLEAFRRAELVALTSVLASISKLNRMLGPAGVGGVEPTVVALGGGTPTMPESVKLIRGTSDGVTVYLRASAEELQERLRADTGDRPSLTGANPIEEVPAVLAQRDELYRSIADEIIETDGLSPRAVAELVARAVG